ncbi:MAG: NADPH:quinone reductase [Pirellulaceae bacterium]|nr:NADPH:quinone reductase [Pirellulaceae bacterium]
MKAAYIEKTGAPDVIQYGELPDPQCGPDQVLLQVGAVSVNPIDTYIRNGANYWPLPQPFIIGCDVAGTILKVGDKVRHLEAGQRVWGSNQGLLGRQGTFSSLAAIDAAWLYPTPDNTSDDQAAAIALVGITARLGLLRDAVLQPGQTIFVRGGTGGVGSMVVQMAKAVGAIVITTAGSPEKAAECRQLGADLVIEYKTQSVQETLLAFAPSGVHVFWETLRDPDFDLAVSCLAERGTMILMAGRTARPEFPVGPFYVKGCSLKGLVMFKASASEQQAAASDINHWLVNGKLKAKIDRVLPLSQSAEAHRLQEDNTINGTGCLAGKIVLNPSL